jgi:hypothetical protein
MLYAFFALFLSFLAALFVVGFGGWLLTIVVRLAFFFSASSCFGVGS